jgi:hypothetical protein
MAPKEMTHPILVQHGQFLLERKRNQTYIQGDGIQNYQGRRNHANKHVQILFKKTFLVLG